jgi:hypothetical protein
MKLRLLGLCALLVLGACAEKPRAPDWQINAHDSLARFATAYLKGDARTAEVEFNRARSEVASTGQAAQAARVELTRCAAAVASLVLDPCEGFERLRADAPDSERAYADFLAGRIAPAQVALLPVQYRAIAGGREDAAAVQAIADPLSRLVAVAVLFRTGRASPEMLALASDTASQQGWRRPLLAWLGVQAQRAERAGAREEAERIRRRMALIGQDKPGATQSR